MSRRKVKSTQYSKDTKETIAKLGVAWLNRGSKLKDFQKLVFEAGIRVTLKTIRNWIHLVKSPKPRSPLPKKRGRRESLGVEEKAVLSGYVLEQNQLGVVVDLAKITQFAREKLGISISLSTSSRLMNELGFSSRVAKVADGKKIKTTGQLVESCTTFIKQLRQSGVFLRSNDLIGSMDFTYTSNGSFHPKTFALKPRWDNFPST